MSTGFARIPSAPARDAVPVFRRPSALPSSTLYRSGIAARLAWALGMAGLVWLAIAWALAS